MAAAGNHSTTFCHYTHIVHSQSTAYHVVHRNTFVESALVNSFFTENFRITNYEYPRKKCFPRRSNSALLLDLKEPRQSHLTLGRLHAAKNPNASASSSRNSVHVIESITWSLSPTVRTAAFGVHRQLFLALEQERQAQMKGPVIRRILSAYLCTRYLNDNSLPLKG